MDEREVLHAQDPSATSGDASPGQPAASSTSSLTLPAAPQSARTARRFVAEVLSSSANPAAEAWEMAAQLLVTELVTNAILHARTDVRIFLTLEPDSLLLAVRDGSVRTPAPRNYSADATTGRGLGLVQRLSQEWGTDPAPDGKTVWARIGSIDWESLIALEGGLDEDAESGAERWGGVSGSRTGGTSARQEPQRESA